MRALTQCLRRKKHHEAKDVAQANGHHEPLPFLPTQRLPVPVPSTQRENQSKNEDNYGSFGRLPPEIRRTILLHAFGERTLHVDLTYRHPLVRNNATREGTQNDSERHCGLGSNLVTDKTLPKSWQWFSCVCHRRPETIEGDDIPMFKLESKIWPCEDQCLEGLLCGCNHRRTESGTDDCFIGAMGWLLTCREAYQEGMDVLFTTNTFYMSSLDLLLNLPRLIPPERLETMASLQLAWGTHERGSKDRLLDGIWDDQGSGKDISALSKLCQMIPQIFPNVRHLDVFLQSWIRPPRVVSEENALPVMERAILAPIEDMFRSLGSGRHLSLAIPVEAWRALSQRHMDQHGENLVLERHSETTGRFWKSLGAELKGRDLGYWISSGWNDTSLVTHAYGTSDVWGYYRRMEMDGPGCFPT